MSDLGNNILKKLVTVEFSKDINNPNIAIIGEINDNKKIVNIYRVNRDAYTPKLKLKELSHNTKDLKEVAENSELICRLVFNNNESIESLIGVLAEMYKLELP